MGVYSSYKNSYDRLHGPPSNGTGKTLSFLVPLPICLLAFSTAVSCQLASAATFEINFGFVITHSRLFLFTLAAMEAKLWNARARKETSQSGMADAKAETDAKVSFANESYRRRDVHNIDAFIMSLKICSLDNNDSFA
mmetsp:Transcript_5730/g.8564  ORF Transcript_5730/g.8564 Transcript_5730/m.8564 type:complete len:138 (+) Transcript_5730:1879-2292(+)